MHPNQQTIEMFYAAFARLDPDTMARCYADDAVFDDEVFSLRGKREVTGMWRMLCEATKAKGADVWKLEYRDVQADAERGSAHWDAHYRFSATGRMVDNSIDARFEFNPAGQIVRHRDRFDFWALVAPGAGRAGRAAGLDADDPQQGARAGARPTCSASWPREQRDGLVRGLRGSAASLSTAREIFARFGGKRDKPPLLLLHGFPQTHAIWHRVAQHLMRRLFSGACPTCAATATRPRSPGLPDHSNYSKRAMAQDMVDLMAALGCGEFFLCGHDRGGRVAHRLALDHPERVRKLCVIDIAPTLDMYNATDMTFARYYYHWFHLIQPSPLPETMIGANARMYLHTKLGGWGAGGLDYIEPQALAEYERCFCRAESIHAACEDYRASAGIDLDHDRASRARGEQDRLRHAGALGPRRVDREDVQADSAVAGPMRGPRGR